MGALLVEVVTPVALEVTLAAEQDLRGRADEADRLRCQQVERARYEAELARRRYLRVGPDNRLVADALESGWNDRLRARLARARCTCSFRCGATSRASSTWLQPPASGSAKRLYRRTERTCRLLAI
jgi:hypothetical protein